MKTIICCKPKKSKFVDSAPCLDLAAIQIATLMPMDMWADPHIHFSGEGGTRKTEKMLFPT